MTVMNDDNKDNDYQIQMITISIPMIIKILLINEIITIKNNLIVKFIPTMNSNKKNKI